MTHIVFLLPSRTSTDPNKAFGQVLMGLQTEQSGEEFALAGSSFAGSISRGRMVRPTVGRPLIASADRPAGLDRTQEL
jgi:hypothetical protein